MAANSGDDDGNAEVSALMNIFSFDGNNKDYDQAFGDSNQTKATAARPLRSAAGFFVRIGTYRTLASGLTICFIWNYESHLHNNPTSTRYYHFKRFLSLIVGCPDILVNSATEATLTTAAVTTLWSYKRLSVLDRYPPSKRASSKPTALVVEVPTTITTIIRPRARSDGSSKTDGEEAVVVVTRGVIYNSHNNNNNNSSIKRWLSRGSCPPRTTR